MRPGISRSRTGENKKDEQFALNGYYGVSFVGSAQTGVVLTGTGHHNNRKWGEILRFFLQASSDAKGVFYEARLLKYLRLDFRDQLGERHIEYYHIQQVGGGRRIDTTEGERLEALYEKLSRPRAFDIDSVTGDELLRVFEK